MFAKCLTVVIGGIVPLCQSAQMTKAAGTAAVSSHGRPAAAPATRQAATFANSDCVPDTRRIMRRDMQAKGAQQVRQKSKLA